MTAPTKVVPKSKPPGSPALSTLTGRLTNLPTLALQEREKVDVDFVLVRAREPVRCTGIDLEAGVPDELRRGETRGADRHDLALRDFYARLTL